MNKRLLTLLAVVGILSIVSPAEALGRRCGRSGCAPKVKSCSLPCPAPVCTENYSDEIVMEPCKVVVDGVCPHRITTCTRTCTNVTKSKKCDGPCIPLCETPGYNGGMSNAGGMMGDMGGTYE